MTVPFDGGVNTYQMLRALLLLPHGGAGSLALVVARAAVTVSLNGVVETISAVLHKSLATAGGVSVGVGVELGVGVCATACPALNATNSNPIT